MGGAGPGDLFALASEFLSACEDALDTIPTLEPGLVGSPARAFVSPGQSADDCFPQLSVWAGPVTDLESFNTQPGHRLAKINMVVLTARIIRCIETRDVPPDEIALETFAMQVDADGWALWNHLYNLWLAGALFTLCDEVQFVSLVPIVPSGGSGGWVLTLRVALDGYQETIASS